MDVFVKCNLIEERLAPNGTLSKRVQKPGAMLELLDARTLSVSHKTGHYSLRLDENLSVHHRFAKEGKATLCFKTQGVQLLLSDAPTKPLMLILSKLVASDKENNQPPASLKRSNSNGSVGSNESGGSASSKMNQLLLLKRRRRSSSTGSSQSEQVAKPPMAPTTLSSILSPEALNTQQKLVLKLVAQGCSLFFTGSAGTGKSFVLKHILAFLPRESTFVTATTGLAASLVGGTTIHSFAGFSNHIMPTDTEMTHFIKSNRSENWKRCSALIVDEISMLDGRYFDKMDAIARAVKRSSEPFGGIQVIVCGDFFQLPPVNTGESEAQTVLCFQSNAWRRRISRAVLLEKVHRQTENEFIQVLSEIREGRCSNQVIAFLQRCSKQVIEYDGIEPTLLHSHNDAVDSVNASRLRNLHGESVFFEARDSTDLASVRESLDRVCPVRRRMEYKDGAQVILVKNIDVVRGLVNGARGRIVRFTETGLPVVKFLSGAEEIIGREKFSLKNGNVDVAYRSQIPLSLAWALSIHKSQGMSLDCLEVSLSKVFASGQAYVALSRARSATSLRIVDMPSDWSRVIHANPFVLQYYQKLAELALKQRLGAPAPKLAFTKDDSSSDEDEQDGSRCPQA